MTSTTLEAPRQDTTILTDEEIQRRVAAIRGSWTDEERAERAELGRQRRAELAAMLTVCERACA